MIMYAVFGDFRFEGLFRSRSAAERWLVELLTYPINWHEVPVVEECNEDSEFEHRNQTSAAGSVRIAIRQGHFGRGD